MKEVKIKFKPTDNVFMIPEAEAIRILKEDRGNYEVLDKDFKLPETPVVLETTVFQKVVEGADKVKGLDKYSYAELKKFAKKNGLDTKGKTEELRARCIEFTKVEG